MMREKGGLVQYGGRMSTLPFRPRPILPGILTPAASTLASRIPGSARAMLIPVGTTPSGPHRPS